MRDATALYTPYTRAPDEPAALVAAPVSSAASIACSRVVAGPLSTTSVDSSPVSATSSSSQYGAPAATMAPAAASPR